MNFRIIVKRAAEMLNRIVVKCHSQVLISFEIICLESLPL